MNQSQLDTVTRAAARRRDEAARELSASERDYQASQKKLDMLRQYRVEYSEWIDRAKVSGISPQRLSNAEAFLSSLDTAISEQERQTQTKRRGRDQRHDTWRGQAKRVSAVTSLSHKRRQQAQALEERKDQKRNDEAASRVMRQTQA